MVNRFPEGGAWDSVIQIQFGRGEYKDFFLLVIVKIDWKRGEYKDINIKAHQEKEGINYNLHPTNNPP